MIAVDEGTDDVRRWTGLQDRSTELTRDEVSQSCADKIGTEVSSLRKHLLHDCCRRETCDVA